jgi:hypothetical protein
MPTVTIKWIKINLKVLDTINDNRSIIGSTEVARKNGSKAFAFAPDAVFVVAK